MAIFRMFADILASISGVSDICTQKLEHIAATHSHFAYYGNRKDLKEKILERVSDIRQRNQNCDSDELPDEKEKVVRQWFRKKAWATNSGSFPDFVLEWQDNGLLGDGAIIELKDSKGAQIASFNSTLPEAKKKLSSLSKGVLDAIVWYQKSICKPINLEDTRDCFYLIRTHRGQSDKVRLSLVHGAFFETISTQDLLRSVWERVFEEAEVGKSSLSNNTLEKILKLLSDLDRETIAQTRRIEGASIKPRLRIMAEVESEGNPHTYGAIPPCTFNLIFKPGVEHRTVDQFIEWFEKDGIGGVTKEDESSFSLGSKVCHLKTISHKRNGDFVLIQYQF